MPESKTIEIDEIVTPDGSPDNDPKQTEKSGAFDSSQAPAGNPFSDMEKMLPWKARWTLRITRWFMLLRSKPWGKWIILPVIILTVLLAIPVGMILILTLIIRSLIKSLSR